MLLRLEDITVKFGGLTALSGLTLDIAEDSVVGLVGPNGAGKTTVFNVISGLVRPASGGASFNGLDLLKRRMHQRARVGIGRTFQNPQPLHGLTARENLVVAQRFGAGAVDDGQIDAILRFLDLEERANIDAATGLTLSEQKRLEVGKALATRPKLLMLDEVLAGLEIHGKRAFTQMIARLHREWHLAMIVIEHDIETISRLCRRCVVLNFGEVIADGTPEQVFDDPEVRRSYTGEGDA
ncbi:MAG: ATP-binding cassette domain-containing protein [Rhodoplanes sp.]